jgi:hypothetical protein
MTAKGAAPVAFVGSTRQHQGAVNRSSGLSAPRIHGCRGAPSKHRAGPCARAVPTGGTEQSQSLLERLKPRGTLRPVSSTDPGAPRAHRRQAAAPKRYPLWHRGHRPAFGCSERLERFVCPAAFLSKTRKTATLCGEVHPRRDWCRCKTGVHQWAGFLKRPASACCRPLWTAMRTCPMQTGTIRMGQAGATPCPSLSIAQAADPARSSRGGHAAARLQGRCMSRRSAVPNSALFRSLMASTRIDTGNRCDMSIAMPTPITSICASRHRRTRS